MFAFSSTVRLTGIILLPIEFFILSIFIINNYLRSKKIKNEENIKNINKKIILLALAIIPWISFLC